ncbi:MAG: DUF1015 domain-containing protein, partial [Pirellulales bacterium]
MPDIQAFRGLRYDLGHVGDLSNVVAPPYDVIPPEMQEELYDKHPANVVRLILNREEPGDDEVANRYTRAAKFLGSWRREGVLFEEADSAIYVYHQVFTDGGVTYTRRGFMARVRLERFGEGKIFPHEETHSGPKADRLKLFSACKANLSQIFGIYPDPDSAAQEILERAIVGQNPVQATDHLGVVHQIWPVSDVEVATKVNQVMGPKPAFIADGHHRYETACNYRDQVASELGGIDPNHPANFVLMMCVSMSDPGMIVLPTHRLFRDVPPMTADELTAKLGDHFACEAAGEGADIAADVWEQVAMEDEQGTIALFTRKDNRWTLARITGQGRERMAEIAAEHSDAWQGLGVSILHRLIVADLLDLAALPSPKYVRAIDEVIEGLQHGDAAGRDNTGQISAGGQFELAALVMPATLEHIQLISEANERMPAKSTYFYPKLLCGLVINPLE